MKVPKSVRMMKTMTTEAMGDEYLHKPPVKRFFNAGARALVEKMRRDQLIRRLLKKPMFRPRDRQWLRQISIERLEGLVAAYAPTHGTPKAQLRVTEGQVCSKCGGVVAHEKKKGTS